MEAIAIRMSMWQPCWLSTILETSHAPRFNAAYIKLPLIDRLLVPDRMGKFGARQMAGVGGLLTCRLRRALQKNRRHGSIATEGLRLPAGWQFDGAGRGIIQNAPLSAPKQSCRRHIFLLQKRGDWVVEALAFGQLFAGIVKGCHQPWHYQSFASSPPSLC
ncbi:hypothetical protein VHN57_18805 [Sphingobium sp. WW5]